MARLIRLEDGAASDDLGNKANAIGFLPCHGRHGAALALASDDHDAALAGLVLSKATVDAVLFRIGRPNVATEVRAIDRVASAISTAMASRSLWASTKAVRYCTSRSRGELQAADTVVNCKVIEYDNS